MYKCMHMCLCVYRRLSKTCMGWKIPERAANNQHSGQEKKMPPFPGLPRPPHLCQRQWQEAKVKERDRGEPNQAGLPLFHTECTETRGLQSFFINVSSGLKGLTGAMLTNHVPGLTYRPQTADFIQSC